MQFDWFTFAAQIVNFVILLFLLQRFLYAPILQAMQAREEKIAARFQEAEIQAQKAHHEAELFQKKRRDLEEQRTDLIAEIEVDAQLQRKQLMDEARQEVDDVRNSWFAAIAREKAVYLQAVRQRLSEQLFRIVRRALNDLADATLEEQIVTIFAQRLQQLDGSLLAVERSTEPTKIPEHEETALVQAMQKPQQRVVVRSAFGLTEAQQAIFIDRLHELSGRDRHEAGLQIDFEEAPDLLCGIEVQVYGHRISWSLHDYIESLEQHLDDLFEADGASDIQADMQIDMERERLVAA